MEPNKYGLTKVAYSVNETLQILSLGRNILYRLVNEGDLPIIKVGKRSLFAASDIIAFLDRHRDAPLYASPYGQRKEA